MFLLYILINNALTCDQCPIFSGVMLPVNTRIGAGCKCTASFPSSNYIFLDVSYNYGQKISQSFYQNDILVGECPLSSNCNKRISLNPNYGVTIITQRQTATNSYGTITNGHFINFGKKFSTEQTNNCYFFPEFNVDDSEQSGYITSNCIYRYTYTFANNFIINADFNDYVTIKILSSSNIILYTNISNSFFTEINTDFDEITILISSINNLQINWLNIYELYSDISDNENLQYENIEKNFSQDIHLMIITYIIISVLFISCIVFLSCAMIGFYKNKSVYEQV